MRYVWLVLKVIVIVGAFNAAGDIGPAIDLLAFLFVIGIAIGHMLGSKDGDNRVTRFGDGAGLRWLARVSRWDYNDSKQPFGGTN